MESYYLYSLLKKRTLVLRIPSLWNLSEKDTDVASFLCVSIDMPSIFRKGVLISRMSRNLYQGVVILHHQAFYPFTLKLITSGTSFEENIMRISNRFHWLIP